MITVLNQYTWHHSKTNCSYGGLSSQVTHCRFNCIEFYVRENITGIDSFLISSGERWGDKTGKKPRASRQVLELLINNANHFEVIKQVVLKSDPLHRPVVTNNRFTLQWIKELISNNKFDTQHESNKTKRNF